MKLSLFIVASSAVLAMAGPIDRRAMETTVVYDYVTVTVTRGSEPGSTGVPNRGRTRTRTRPTPTPELSTPTPEFSTQEPKQTETPSPSPEPTTVIIPSPEPQPTTAAEPKPETTTTKQEPSTTVSQPESTGNTLADTFVNAHNAHRANHSAPDVAWDSDLASRAQTIADSCVFKHQMDVGGGGYGQNLASQGSTADNSNDDPRRYAAVATHDQWYNGEFALYNGLYGKEPDLGGLSGWGHFTQVVWKGTTRIGCAVKFCPKGTMSGQFNNWYTVCNYGPPGNFVGQFAANVLEPLGQPTVSA